jgi:hypothetical protein
MNLILIIGIVFVIALWTAAITQIAIAKKHSNSDDKTDQQQSKDKPTKEVNPSDNTAATTTTVHTVGNVVIPLQQGDTVTVTTCSDGSDKNNDRICAESAANPEQAISQPQNTPTPQSNPIVNTNPSSNPSITTLTNTENKNVDNQQSSSGGSTTTSNGSNDNEESTLTTEENKRQNHDNDKFVLIADDSTETNSKIGLFQIKEDSSSDTLDTSVLPKKIHGLDSFPNISEATNQISEWDHDSDDRHQP